MTNIATLRLGIDARGAKAGARQFEGAAARVTKSASGISRVLGGLFAGAGLAAAAAKAAKTIAGFEETMATLRGVAIDTTQTLEAQEAQFTALSEAAREMGATTRYSAQEAAEGLLFLARAGFDAQSQLDALPATLNLAAAGGLELGQAADFASNIVSQFGLNASETERVVDTLIKTANSANTNVLQLAEAMKYAGPVAGALGTDVEEAAAALGVLGDTGIQATMAGTSLRAMYAALLDPTTKARVAMDEMGVTMDQVNPEKVGLTDALRVLGQAGLNAGDALAIFGRRNVAAGLVLVDGVDKVEALTAANHAAAGEAQRLADIANNTLSGAFRSLKSAVEELYLQMGDGGLGGVLRNTVDTMTGAARILAGMEDSVERNVVASHRLAGALRAVAAAGGAVIAMKLAGFFTVAAKAALGLTAAIATNPLGALAVGITAAIGALAYFKDEMVTIKGVTASVGDFVASAWEQLFGRLKMWFEATVAIAKWTWEQVEKAAVQGLNNISNQFAVFFQQTTLSWADLGSMMTVSFKDAIDNVLGMLVGFGNAADAVLTRVGRAFKQLDTALTTEGLSIGERVWAALEASEIADYRWMAKDIEKAFDEALAVPYVDVAVSKGAEVGMAIVSGARKVLEAQGIDIAALTDSIDLGKLQDDILAGAEGREFKGFEFIADAEGFIGPLTQDVAKLNQEMITLGESIGNVPAFNEGDGLVGPIPIGDIDAVRELVSHLEAEEAALKMTNAARQESLLLREFGARAAELEGDEIEALRDRLIASSEAIHAQMIKNDLANSIQMGFERGITDAIMHLDNLKDVALSVLAEIQQAFIQAFIKQSGVQSFLSGFAGALAGAGGGGGDGFYGPPPAGAEHGAAVGPGYGYEFLERGGMVGLAGGGITDMPTAVGMVGDRVAISSEFGQREAVMPLTRGSGGDLGVKVEIPDQGPRHAVTINNNFPNVTNADEFGAAQRHQAADARRKLGRFN